VYCPECRIQLTALIKGFLGPEEAARMRAHLDECEGCRREYAETQSLIAGMIAAREEIRSEHVSSLLLYQYVESLGSLDTETFDRVRSHVEQCDECRKDAAVIRELREMDSASGAATAAEAPPRRRGWRRGWRRVVFARRLAPVFAAVVALAVFAGAWLVLTGDGSLPRVAEVVSHTKAAEAGYPIVALSNDTTTRGEERSPAGAPAQIAGDGGRAVIVTLEAVTFADEEMVYGVEIEKAGGTPVWRSDVTPGQLESGGLWLVVDRDDLEPGIYQIRVVESQGDYRATVSTARFEITP
jgi:anti-sigma factor RsiW